MTNNYLIAQSLPIDIDSIVASATLDIFDFTYLILTNNIDAVTPFGKPFYLKYSEGAMRDTILSLLTKVITFKKQGEVGVYSMTLERLPYMFKEEVEKPGTYIVTIDKFTNNNNLMLLSAALATSLYWHSYEDRINAGIILYNSQFVTGLNDTKFRIHSKSYYYSPQHLPVVRDIHNMLSTRIKSNQSRLKTSMHPVVKIGSSLMEGANLLNDTVRDYSKFILDNVYKDSYTQEEAATIFFALVGITDCSLFGGDGSRKIAVNNGKYYLPSLPDLVYETIFNPSMLNRDMQDTLDILKQNSNNPLIGYLTKLAINTLSVQRFAPRQITLLDFLILNSRTLRGYLTSHRSTPYTHEDGISYSILKTRMAKEKGIASHVIF